MSCGRSHGRPARAVLCVYRANFVSEAVTPQPEPTPTLALATAEPPDALAVPASLAAIDPADLAGRVEQACRYMMEKGFVPGPLGKPWPGYLATIAEMERRFELMGTAAVTDLVNFAHAMLAEGWEPERHVVRRLLVRSLREMDEDLRQLMRESPTEFTYKTVHEQIEGEYQYDVVGGQKVPRMVEVPQRKVKPPDVVGLMGRRIDVLDRLAKLYGLDKPDPESQASATEELTEIDNLATGKRKRILKRSVTQNAKSLPLSAMSPEARAAAEDVRRKAIESKQRRVKADRGGDEAGGGKASPA
jgi:hypothetical protein